MFVDGQFVDSVPARRWRSSTRRRDVIAEVPQGTAEDVDRAVAAAEQAWESWQLKTPKIVWSCCWGSQT